MHSFRAVGATLTLVLTFLAAQPSAQRMVRRIFVSATDSSGATVHGLVKADFLLSEGGKPREISRVSADVPMRVILLVESTSAIAPMITSFRSGLQAFYDGLPAELEVGFMTTAGQLKIRVPPGTDRQKLLSEFQSFSQELGGNVVIDALLDADERFFRKTSDRWPVFVVVTTDSGATRGEQLILRYNKFLTDFMLRGGSAHAVLIQGSRPRAISDFIENLVRNTNGVLETMAVSNPLAAKMKDLAARIAADRAAMSGRYEVEYPSEATASTVELTVTRPGVTVRVSPLRPF
jgi:hypothetical protein